MFGTSLPATFSTWFLKQNISLAILPDQISLSGYLYLLRYWAIYLFVC